MFVNDENLESCAYSWHEVGTFSEYDELKINCSYFVYHEDRKEIVVATFEKHGEELLWVINDLNGVESLEISDLKSVTPELVEKELYHFA